MDLYELLRVSSTICSTDGHKSNTYFPLLTLKVKFKCVNLWCKNLLTHSESLQCHSWLLPLPALRVGLREALLRLNALRGREGPCPSFNRQQGGLETAMQMRKLLFMVRGRWGRPAGAQLCSLQALQHFLISSLSSWRSSQEPRKTKCTIPNTQWKPESIN